MPQARELTVQILDDDSELAAGLSGWTWGGAAGIAMTWVRQQARGAGLGSRLLDEFEREARARGCTRVFVTSFTFQAPGFYERHGYREIFRWEGVPTPDVGRRAPAEGSLTGRAPDGFSSHRGWSRRTLAQS